MANPRRSTSIGSASRSDGAINARAFDGEAAGDGDEPVDYRFDPVEFVRGNHYRSSGSRSIGDERVDDVSSTLIESGVGFIEQPQFWTSSCSNSECRAAALPSRQRFHRNVVEAAVDLHAFARGPFLLF